MRTRLGLIKAVLVSVLWASLPIQAANATCGSCAVEYDDIKRTIEENCAECYDASAKVFIGAVQSLEQLIDDGLADPAALRLLADSYRVWALAYSGDGNTEESRMLLRKSEKIYAELARESNDATLWLAYANSLEDLHERLNALKKAEALAPQDPAVQDSLGMLYAMGLDDPDRGIMHLRRALELETGIDKLRYGDHLAWVLQWQGSDDEADQVRESLRAFEEKLERDDREKSEN